MTNTQVRPYDPLPWYEVAVGDTIKYRSPFFGVSVVKVVERESAKVMKVRRDDGAEKWITTDNLTLESINDV